MAEEGGAKDKNFLVDVLKPLVPSGSEQTGKQSDLSRLITENGIGERTEIPAPTSEQMTDLWMDIWNLKHAPGLDGFFKGASAFPITAENYASYADSLVKHFSAMKQILDGKKLSELDWNYTNQQNEPRAAEAPPTASLPFQHDITYQSNNSKPTESGQS